MIMADKIVQLRKKLGWSQEEFAERMEVSRQAVSKWEGALSTPDLDRVLRMAALFGVSTDYLLKDEIESPEYSQDDEAPEVRRISMEEANEFLEIKTAAAKKIALAVVLCALAPLCLILFGAASEVPEYAVSENFAGGVGLITLVVIASAAACVFISCGMRSSRYEFLVKERFETQYGVIGMVRERQTRFKPLYARSMLSATCVCALSAIPLFSCAFFDGDILLQAGMLCLMILLLGIGSAIFIYAGVINGSIQKLLQEGDYAREKKAAYAKWGGLTTAFWLLATALYLFISFTTGRWDMSWLVWPAAAAIYAALCALLESFTKK